MVLPQLEKIVQKVEMWQTFTKQWENRLQHLFGVGKEIAETQRLIETLCLMAPAFWEIKYTAQTFEADVC